MTYSHRDPYEGTFGPSASYGAYWPPLSATADTQRYTPADKPTWLVMQLGLAAYVLSYWVSTPAGGGWGVRLATLAAIGAALSFVSRRSAPATAVAALAVTGFLESLRLAITASPQPGWATIVITVVAALQAAVAIAALTKGHKGSAAPDYGQLIASTPSPYWAQTAQHYPPARVQPPQQQQPATAQATAQASAAATAPRQASVAERDALYAEYLHVQPPGPSEVAPPAADARGHLAQPVSGLGPVPGPHERIRPGVDSTGEAPTQPF